jgi:hypothetical protein
MTWLTVYREAAGWLTAVQAACLAWSGWLVRHRPRARLTAAKAPPPDPWRENMLARACGPCNDVDGTRKCICAGHCGHQRCRAGAVPWDLAGALQRITRGGQS